MVQQYISLHVQKLILIKIYYYVGHCRKSKGNYSR